MMTNANDINNERYLFKALTIGGEWVRGYLSVLEKDISQTVRKGYYINNFAGLPFAYNVRPETIGQCLGIKDIDGCLLFVHDVVEFYIGQQNKENTFERREATIHEVSGGFLLCHVNAQGFRLSENKRIKNCMWTSRYNDTPVYYEINRVRKIGNRFDKFVIPPNKLEDYKPIET